VECCVRICGRKYCTNTTIRPYLNQFTQPDTIIPDIKNPQSLNRYAYVLNNPIRYNDPTGHVQSCEFGDEGDCGRGADTAQIQKYFTQDEKLKKNPRQVSWANYYATLHEVSLSIEKYRQNVNKTTLNVLNADIRTAASYKHLASVNTPQWLHNHYMDEYPEILGGGFVGGDATLGSKEGVGMGGANSGGPGIIPQFKTTPRQPPFGSTPIPRRNGGEFTDLTKEI